MKRSASGETGAVKNVLVAAQDRKPMLSLMAATTTKIITIIVTEKGYCHDPGSGNLNFLILRSRRICKTPLRHNAVSALLSQHWQGVKSFTVLGCNSLPDSGSLMRNIVGQFTGRIDPVLAEWIAPHTAFANARSVALFPPLRKTPGRRGTSN